MRRRADICTAYTSRHRCRSVKRARKNVSRCFDLCAHTYYTTCVSIYLHNYRIPTIIMIISTSMLLLLSLPLLHFARHHVTSAFAPPVELGQNAAQQARSAPRKPSTAPNPTTVFCFANISQGAQSISGTVFYKDLHAVKQFFQNCVRRFPPIFILNAPSRPD